MPAARAPEEDVPPVPEAEAGSAGAPGAYARLRAGRPVTRARLPQGEAVWVVSRYADVRRALADERLVRPVIATWPPGRGTASAARVLTLLELNGADHARVRRASAPAFAPRGLERLAPVVREIAGQHADAIARQGPPADLVAGFTEPFPLRVLCALLGVPEEERGEFVPHVETVLAATLVPLERVLGALERLQEYAEGLVDRGRARGSGLLGELAGTLERDDLVTLTVSLLMAGYKTNVQHFANALLTLLDAGPAARELVTPAAMDGTVEELLRHVPLMNAIVVLVATEDLEIAGRPVRRGDAVLPIIASANRDASVFTAADDFDPARRPNPHLAFGRGPHYCLGAHLTRLQLRIMLETLFARLPAMRLAIPREDLRWEEPSSPLRAPLTLPVTW
ncbi:cytochrome P450 [Bailinhaonella thermotolerans]|uniref:Cytochrome P450 n=1 Tax=Bailinhaonella thermotolerans TaxID=1070861 RepID=A0A3A4B6G1_9ACTN|nr:cytochrome P450 [Bailinhaonella thermotolerans]